MNKKKKKCKNQKLPRNLNFFFILQRLQILYICLQILYICLLHDHGPVWSVSHGLLNYAVFVTIFCECMKPRETAYRWRCSSSFPSHWTWSHHCITLEKTWTQAIRGRQTPAKEKQEGCVWGLFNSCETLRRAMNLILSLADVRRGSKNKKLSTLPSPYLL